MLRLDQLRAYSRFSMVLDGRGSCRPNPLLGWSEFGLLYMSQRIPPSKRRQLRLIFTRDVLAAMHRPDEEVCLEGLTRPVVDQMIELMLDFHEIRGTEREEARKYLMLIASPPPSSPS